MTKAETIAESIIDDTDLGAAAVLVSMLVNSQLVLIGEEESLDEQLDGFGCVASSRVTALGREVAKDLCRKGLFAGSED